MNDFLYHHDQITTPMIGDMIYFDTEENVYWIRTTSGDRLRSNNGDNKRPYGKMDIYDIISLLTSFTGLAATPVDVREHAPACVAFQLCRP